MCSIYLLVQCLHHLLKYVDFFEKKNYHHKLLGFIDQFVFQMFMFFPSQNLKSIYIFESLSLKLMQGNKIVYLTMLAPFNYIIL